MAILSRGLGASCSLYVADKAGRGRVAAWEEQSEGYVLRPDRGTGHGRSDSEATLAAREEALLADAALEARSCGS